MKLNLSAKLSLRIYISNPLHPQMLSTFSITWLEKACLMFCNLLWRNSHAWTLATIYRQLCQAPVARSFWNSNLNLRLTQELNIFFHSSARSQSCCANYVANCLYQGWDASDNNVSWSRRATLYMAGEKRLPARVALKLLLRLQATSKDSFSRGVVEIPGAGAKWENMRDGRANARGCGRLRNG